MTKTTRLNMDVYPFRGMKIPRRTAAQRAHFDWLSMPRVRILAAVDPGFKQEALAATTPEAREALDPRTAQHWATAGLWFGACKCGCGCTYTP